MITLRQSIGGVGIAEEPAALIAHGGVCEGGGAAALLSRFLYSESFAERLPTDNRWPHFTALLAQAGGHSRLGRVAPIERAAIAADERALFATLVRRDGESVNDLLQRLDYAIYRAAILMTTGEAAPRRAGTGALE